MEHIRALEKMFETLDPVEIQFYCKEIKKMCKRHDNSKPQNTPKRWTKEEEDKLISLKNGGMSIKDLASELERSELAVILRIEKLVTNSIPMH